MFRTSVPHMMPEATCPSSVSIRPLEFDDPWRPGKGSNTCMPAIPPVFVLGAGVLVLLYVMHTNRSLSAHVQAIPSALLSMPLPKRSKKSCELHTKEEVDKADSNMTFVSTTCGHCKKWRTENDGVAFLDVGKHPDIANAYNVEYVPVSKRDLSAKVQSTHSAEEEEEDTQYLHYYVNRNTD